MHYLPWAWFSLALYYCTNTTYTCINTRKKQAQKNLHGYCCCLHKQMATTKNRPNRVSIFVLHGSRKHVITVQQTVKNKLRGVPQSARTTSTTTNAMMDTCRLDPNTTPMINGIPEPSSQISRPHPLTFGHHRLRQNKANKLNTNPANTPITNASKKCSNSSIISTSPWCDDSCSGCGATEAVDVVAANWGGGGAAGYCKGTGTMWWWCGEEGEGEESLWIESACSWSR